MTTRIFYSVIALFVVSFLQAQWQWDESNIGIVHTTDKVGIGTSTPDAKLEVNQSSNTDWAVQIENAGGHGKGMLIKAGHHSNADLPVLKVESWSSTSPLGVGLQVESDGKVKVGLDPSEPFNYNAKFNVYQSSNTEWAGRMENAGGYGKGLLIKAGYSGNVNLPALQVESWNANNAGLAVFSNGQVGINIDTNNPGEDLYADTEYKLHVNGKIAAEELNVQLSGNWPDYVFRRDYHLLSLKEVEAHIQSEGRLPNMPGAAEVEENGIAVGDMQRRMMEKIEELTLHLIEQDKRIKALQEEIAELKGE